MVSSPDNPIEWLNSILRELSRIRLNQYLRQNTVTAERVIERRTPVPEDRMAMILLSGASLRLVFKIHYEPIKTARLASLVYKEPPEALTPHQISDFVKEFCNLTAGALKNELELHGLESGISLPLLARGFDDLFFRPQNGKNLFCDFWILKLISDSLACSTHIEVIDDKIVNNLQPSPLRSLTDSSGDVETL